MKKIGGLAIVAAAVVLMLTGQAFSAEREGAYSFSAPWSWQYSGPAVAGSLPKGEDMSKARSEITDSSNKAVYGGVVYRLGIDTN